LPPLWNESSTAAKDCIAEVMGLCFPEIAKESYTIVKNTMASVVFHVDWLRKTLPANHPLFSTRLFSSFDVGLLRTHIVCGLPSSDGDIQATGVPTHVALKVELAKILFFRRIGSLVRLERKPRDDFSAPPTSRYISTTLRSFMLE
jgi:hypothetical protein